MSGQGAETEDRAPWHERDEYWEAVADTMFSSRRWAVAAEEVDGALSLLAVQPGARLLDLACGVGRHALELARRGFRVTGVDRTRCYLEAAAARAREEGLDIEFVNEDMRTFVRGEGFDAAINLLTSFGYFEDVEDDRRVARNLCQSLRRGGTLLMDLEGREVLARNLCERRWHEDDGVLVLEERKPSSDWGWLRSRHILIDGDQRTEVEFRHRLYSAADLTTLLRQSGFTGVEVYGGLDGVPYDHSARRLVVTARRPAHD